MAIIDQTKTLAQLNNKMELPRDRYLCLCLSEKFAPSQAGNPMLTREWQIIDPEQKEIGGKPTVVGGTKFMQYLVTKNKNEDGEGWDEEASAKSQAKLVDDLTKIGYEGEVDDENPPQIAKGIYADWICGSKPDVRRKTQTPEEKKARKQGEPILDGHGKEIKTYQHNGIELLGLAEKPANQGGF